jgi:hypothetical protein
MMAKFKIAVGLAETKPRGEKNGQSKVRIDNRQERNMGCV